MRGTSNSEIYGGHDRRLPGAPEAAEEIAAATGVLRRGADLIVSKQAQPRGSQRSKERAFLRGLSNFVSGFKKARAMLAPSNRTVGVTFERGDGDGRHFELLHQSLFRFSEYLPICLRTCVTFPRNNGRKFPSSTRLTSAPPEFFSSSMQWAANSRRISNADVTGDQSRPRAYVVEQRDTGCHAS